MSATEIHIFVSIFMDIYKKKKKYNLHLESAVCVQRDRQIVYKVLSQRADRYHLNPFQGTQL